MYADIYRRRSSSSNQQGCCSDDQTSTSITLRIRRRALRYLLTLHLPLLWIQCLAAGAFLIPTDRIDLRLIPGLILTMTLNRIILKYSPNQSNYVFFMAFSLLITLL